MASWPFPTTLPANSHIVEFAISCEDSPVTATGESFGTDGLLGSASSDGDPDCFQLLIGDGG